jgi:hypothetical protein
MDISETVGSSMGERGVQYVSEPEMSFQGRFQIIGEQNMISYHQGHHVAVQRRKPYTEKAPYNVSKLIL